ncbi:predicted protein [Nematostella vectensis]|uniref:vitamin-K-epoxide reductase (warfarin-sensitive) n=1 Tax=Nematostella vectensis TaxID=45351 RepID=A7RY76_NEMVE|nr:vitamin K epoxide reductase complex subunit 1 [Nematostella vectensis]XP_048580121.1 vitamin K epoxide reductase complex subunit 1 [Nematostella vectensis]EDO43588.1 predicted protein [Nematostella vectensis]|eukprot:XP_001635651.1 predicted protein [Nematostella vectensis]
MLAGLLTEHSVVCLSGILVSAYALYVEMRKSKDKNYKAVCDIGENMSCSRVLTSKYSKGFGLVELLVGKDHFMNLPNCLIGIVFYLFQLCLGMVGSSWCNSLLLITSIMSCVGSVYLGYILFVILKDICLVCIATYIVNGTLFYLNYQRVLS